MMNSETNGKEKNHLTLTVLMTEDNYTDQFNIHQKLQHVVDKTIGELKLLIDKSQYELCRRGSTIALDLNKSIVEVGLVDNEELEYRIRNAGGGQ